MSLKITNGVDIIELKTEYCLKLEYEVNRFGKKDNWHQLQPFILFCLS